MVYARWFHDSLILWFDMMSISDIIDDNNYYNDSMTYVRKFHFQLSELYIKIICSMSIVNLKCLMYCTSPLTLSLP